MEIRSTKKETPQELKVGIFGRSGAGKTSLVKTLPVDPEHVLIIDIEDGLEVLRGQGVELDRAALQALIWYPEKELYAKLGIGTKRSAPTDYETEFANVARERGVDVSDIVGDAQP